MKHETSKKQLNQLHNYTHTRAHIFQSVYSRCFGIYSLISAEQSTLAHTFAIVETYSFTKAYLKGA